MLLHYLEKCNRILLHNACGTFIVVTKQEILALPLTDFDVYSRRHTAASDTQCLKKGPVVFTHSVVFNSVRDTRLIEGCTLLENEDELWR